MKLARFPWPFLALLINLGCLVCSYLPLLQLGSIAGVHIDVSALYITTLIVVTLSVKQLWRNRGTLLRSWPWRFLIAFSLYATVATLWSPNPTRALFTAGFLWLMAGLASSVIVWWPILKKESQLTLLILGIGFSISAIVALWQIFGDAFGFSANATLLPAMYQSGHFGVARPVGLALEPQFFASLLLIPFAWLSYTFLKGNRDWKFITGLIFTSTLLVLTLSRGGLIAAIIIVIILIVCMKKWQSGLLLAGLGILSLVAGGLVIAGAASLNTRDSISGYTADQRALSQITLGIIKLPEQVPTAPPSSSSTAQKSAGYVESSTTSRLSMSERSIKLWRSNPATIFFGVGTGGFGARLHQEDRRLPISSVANNYYFEMLAELGMVGALLFGAFIFSILAALVRSRQWFVFALLLGFLIQWYFFSGNANVVHVWVTLGLSIIISSPQLQRRLVQ